MAVHCFDTRLFGKMVDVSIRQTQKIVNRYSLVYSVVERQSVEGAPS